MSTGLRFTFAAPAIASLVAILFAPSLAQAQACTAGWKCGVAYGGSTVMDLYVPTNVDASPGVVVSLHYCSGNSSNARGWFQSSADKYGFVIIAPSAGGNCFDAKPERSGERDAITKMVQYVITQNKADPKRVFAAGASSGACMTNALLAAYPDVFAAGSVLAGVPAGAWTGGNAYGWTTPAGRSAQEWGDIVRKAHQGFTGARPRVQLWHGTSDTTLTYSTNYPAEVLQWTNVLGVSDANATKSEFKTTQDTWARTSYKDGSGTLVLETNVAQNAPHDLSGRGLWADVVRFFGLDNDSPTGGGGTGGAGGTGAGGKASGGAANGGSAGKGGSSSGGTSSGSGGTASGNGGSQSGGASSGGAVGSGGAASGGAVGSGGSASGGAANGAGGSSSGGSPTSGGASTVAGAPNGNGGSVTGGSGGTPSDGDGCGCRIVGHSDERALGALIGLSAAFGALLRRRRRFVR
ncbi:MAG: alpha/beta hydrolase family esterase [Myxococcota bacterium]